MTPATLTQTAAPTTLTDRGLSPEVQDRLGLRVEQVGDRAAKYGLGAERSVWVVVIPYREGFERIRLIDPSDLERIGGGKYRQPSGCNLALYDPLRHLDGRAPRAVVLVEGEVNAASIHQMNPCAPVVGLAGKQGLKPDLAQRFRGVV